MTETLLQPWSADDVVRLLAGIGGNEASGSDLHDLPDGQRFTGDEVGSLIRSLPQARTGGSEGQGGLSRIRAAYNQLGLTDRAAVWLLLVERIPSKDAAAILGGDAALIAGRAAEILGDLCRGAELNGGCRLLIAEDERITALELREALEEMKHQVVAVASTAGQAISAASLHEPDLALVDIRLKGGTDGVSAAREMQDALGVPVILMTAYTDQAARVASIQPYGFLPKPWSDEDLASVLQAGLVRAALERLVPGPQA
jgi:CheY-like chemotaxis protein